MDKMYVIILIMGFWLFLPIPFMLMDIDNYDSSIMQSINTNLGSTTLQSQDISQQKNNDFFTQAGIFFNNIGKFISTVASIIGLYFQMLLLSIPNVPNFINYFMWFLRIVTIVTLYLLLRGN